MPQEKVCRDYLEVPWCLKEPDDQYTMYFDDIGQPPIYWCTACGKQAKEIIDAIDRALGRDPSFAKRFEAAVNKAKEETKNSAN